MSDVDARYLGLTANQLAKIATDLEAENAKLREQVGDACMQLGGAWVRCTELRELCEDMMGFFEDGDWCVKCKRVLDCQAQEQYEDDCLMRFVFRDRMRELGVDDG